ncbi:MAG TPA: regulatory iron-sulfur-containing complex subunit RicT, partial [Herpetosiphonaceae bacterium]|nr:regulatory iron-sulfur-containing complex subunit RicT [Herpetosiphonaceae bacterium]
MPLVVGVKFKDSGKIYHFDPNGQQLELGVTVVVETVRGLELGKVAMPITDMPPSDLIAELKPVVRQPTTEDYDRMRALEARHDEVLRICAERIAAHRLPMRLVRGDWNFDGTRLTIYFTSQQRVDFRHLVRELARIFHARIELRQVGARDEAKLLGGIGPCGRPLCCSTFLPDFARVSVKMAKDQDLPLNPSKISGVCGRLLCCLSYEQEQYLAIKEELPSRGEYVMTPDGPGVVVAVNTIRETVTVDVEGNYQDFTASQLSTIEQGAASVARERVSRGEAAPAAHQHGRGRTFPPASGLPRPTGWTAEGWEDNDLRQLEDAGAAPPPEAPRRERDGERRPNQQQRRQNQQQRRPEGAPNDQRPARPPVIATVRQQPLGSVPEQLIPRNRQTAPADPDEPRTGGRRRRGNRSNDQQGGGQQGGRPANNRGPQPAQAEPGPNQNQPPRREQNQNQPPRRDPARQPEQRAADQRAPEQRPADQPRPPAGPEG